MGFSSVAPSSTSIAQVVWSYTPRTITEQSLVDAIQFNDPNLLTTFNDLSYIPVPYYNNQVSLTQVASFISNLVQNYKAAGLIASFINSNPYNVWHMDFVENLIQNPYLGFTNASLILNNVSTSVLANIATSTSVPVTSLLSFISNAALSANAAQGLLYGLAENYYYNKWIDLVTYNAPSITFSTNATLSTNVLIAQEITVASGVTVTCGTRTCFFVAQSFNNQGTVVAYGAPDGGGCSNCGGGLGGTGGGGVVIIAYTAAVGTINVNGSPGGAGMTATVASTGSRGQGGTGLFLLLSGMTVPIGGTAPGVSALVESYPGYNGGAGGIGAFSSAGAGNSIVYSFANGNDLVTYVIQGVSDWWLSNVVGKAPPSVTPLPMVCGAGGAGGQGSNATGVIGGGGGGGGGGEVVIYGYNIIAGTIDAAGGTGGTGATPICSLTGGGGGGGGIALIFYGPGGLNGTMSYDLAGGSGGLCGTNSYSLAGQPGTYYMGSVTVNG
jgi:hypothetical protein